jgi:hypothetical protein
VFCVPWRRGLQWSSDNGGVYLRSGSVSPQTRATADAYGERSLPGAGHPLHARRSLLDGVDLLNLRATARVVLEEVGYPLNYTVIIELAPEAGCPTSR